MARSRPTVIIPCKCSPKDTWPKDWEAQARGTAGRRRFQLTTGSTGGAGVAEWYSPLRRLSRQRVRPSLPVVAARMGTRLRRFGRG